MTRESGVGVHACVNPEGEARELSGFRMQLAVFVV
jgi:hypothetical protein